jgi:hypothetical protein
MIIMLKGITKHGKNRIHEHGNEWLVIEPGVTPKPAQLFIESVKTGDRRWLNHNFEIIPVDSV